MVEFTVRKVGDREEVAADEVTSKVTAALAD